MKNYNEFFLQPHASFSLYTIVQEVWARFVFTFINVTLIVFYVNIYVGQLLTFHYLINYYFNLQS